MFVLQSHLYTSKISLKPFQLLSKKNSGISPSMNLSHSFSLSLLDLHLTLKSIIVNCEICDIMIYVMDLPALRVWYQEICQNFSSYNSTYKQDIFSVTSPATSLSYIHLFPPTLKQKIFSGSSSEGSCVSGWNNISCFSFSFSQKT